MATEASANLGARYVMAGARFAVCGNCILSTWMGPPRADHLARFDELMVRLSAQYAQGVVMFVTLEPGAMMTDARERRDTEAAYTRWAHAFKAVAQVVEGHNLWAATARSIMTAMRLVDRKPYPIKVFSDTREAARWCAPHVLLPDELVGNDPALALCEELTALRALPGQENQARAR
jgi:hypothetical protein